MMKNAAAAATASSSKRSKKNSDDEERRSKKKSKIKSNKRRRPRVSSVSPSSSYSHSSPRARRKRAKKPEKRKREAQNPDKKNKKKKRSRKSRYRSVSPSSSSSSRSCSSCRGRGSSTGSSVSRAPPPKSKPRVRSRSRGRGRDGDAERGRSRRRRTASYDRRGSRYRSRSCSPCGGTSGPASGSAGRRCRNCSEEKYKEIEQPRLRSVLTVAERREEVEVGIDGKDEQSDKIIQAYDDFSRYDGRRRSNRCQESLESIEKDATRALVTKDEAFEKDGELVLNRTDTQTTENADVGSGDLNRKKSDNSGGSEAAELELLLRQRALQNLKMFQRSLSENARSSCDQVDDYIQKQSHKDYVRVAEAQGAFESLDAEFAGSTEHQGSDQGEMQPAEPRVRSVVSIPAGKDTSSHVISHPSSIESSGKVNKPDPDNSNKGQSNPNQSKRIEESSNEISLQNTLLIKDKQEMRTAAEPGSSTVSDADVDLADRQPTSLLPAHQTMDNANERKQEDSGSEFQQKTFSRMHDGELVQVSYKVYIPKKNPALARRQLQR